MILHESGCGVEKGVKKRPEAQRTNYAPQTFFKVLSVLNAFTVEQPELSLLQISQRTAIAIQLAVPVFARHGGRRLRRARSGER